MFSFNIYLLTLFLKTFQDFSYALYPTFFDLFIGKELIFKIDCKKVSNEPYTGTFKVISILNDNLPHVELKLDPNINVCLNGFVDFIAHLLYILIFSLFQTELSFYSRLYSSIEYNILIYNVEWYSSTYLYSHMWRLSSLCRSWKI